MIATRPPAGRTAIFIREEGCRPISVSMRPDAGIRLAPDKREIVPAQLAGPAMVGKLGREPPVGRVGLGHHHYAACVLVEPVHDPRPRDPANARQALAAMRDQRIDKVPL